MLQKTLQNLNLYSQFPLLQLDVDITTHVHVKEDGPKRRFASVLTFISILIHKLYVLLLIFIFNNLPFGTD